VKHVGAVIVLSTVAAFGLAFVHPFGNPRVEPAKGLDTLLRDANMPADAKVVLMSKCADCHSNETRWPMYSRIAPGSWLIERDIVEGRRHMNLSHWNELTPDQQQVLEAKIVQETRSGDMPPLQYLAIHWGARLSKNNIQALAMLGKSGDSAEATLTGAGDATRGKAVFEKRCTGCHALNADREAPRLAGVFGRKAGSVPGFAYSAALKNSGIIWNEATLEKWLTDSDAMVPNNNMDFQVPKAQERSDLIAYFKQ
jgi:cytochrome c